MTAQICSPKVFACCVVSLLMGISLVPESHAQGGYEPDYAYSDGGGGGSDSGRGILGGIFNTNPNFKYGYLEAQYKGLSFSEDFFDDRGGYFGEISFGGTGNVYVKANGFYAPGKSDDIEDVSYFFASAGPGIALPIGSILDIHFDGGIAYEKFDTELSELADGTIGYYLSPGVRVGLGNNFEVNGALKYRNIDSVGEFSIQLGLHIYINENIVLVGSADFGEEIDTYGVGLRLNF